MEEFSGKNEGMEAAEPPVFVKNFNTFGQAALNLQQNFSRFGNSRALMQNIVDNANNILEFELQWTQSEIDNISEDEYPEIRAEIVQRKTEISDAELQYRSRVDTEDPDIYHFCDEFLDTWTSACAAVCLCHEEVAMGFIQLVELNVAFAVRSLEICQEAVQSKDNSQIVSKFNLTTAIIARLAEACSAMSVQSSTSPAVSELLLGFFNSLGDQNESLATKINSYLTAKENKDESHRVMKLAIETLLETVHSVAALATEEREKLETQDLFAAYSNEVVEVRKIMQIAKEAQEAEVADLHDQGSVTKLAKYAEDTGATPTEAMTQLAQMNDDVGIALLSIHQKITQGSQSDVVNAVNQAAPKLLELPKAAKAYIAEREVELTGMAETIKKNLADDDTQVQEILDNLERAEKCDSNEEAKQIFEESQTKSEELMAKVLTDMKSEDPQMLGHARFETVKDETREISQEVQNLGSDDSDQSGKTRRLTKILSRAKSALKSADSEVESTQKENTESFKEINEKIDRSLVNAHNQLIKATNDMVQSGGKDTSQLTAICEDISNLVELATAVMPFPSSIHREDQYEQEEEDSASNVLSGMLINLTAGGAEPEAKNVAQVKMERKERRLSKRLSGSLVANVRQSVSLRLSASKSMDIPEEPTDDKPKSYVKSQVSEIETSLQLFEKKLQEKEVEPGPKKLTRKLTRFTDITEDIEKEVSTEQPTPDAEPQKKRDLWDEMGNVRIEMVGKAEVVKSGTLDQLVLHLTSVSSDTMSGTDFFETFMVTLQTFTTGEIFLQKMMERYRVPPCPSGHDEKKYHDEFRIPIQIRVCSVLKKWISMRYDQDLSSNPTLIEKLRTFVQQDVAKDYEFLNTNLLTTLQFYTSGEAFLYHQKMSELKGGLLDWESPENARTGKDNSNEPFPGFSSLLNFDIKALANQMTLIDAELFRAIRLQELAGQVWNSKQKYEKAANLLRFINHTNRVSVWIVNTILKERNVKHRARIMTNFVLLCSYLLAMRNFNGVMTVLAGLSTAAVTRLKETKAHLQPKIAKLAQEQEKLMSSLSSFKNYRDALRASSPPTVPFIGILLSDLTFAEDGNADFISGDIINWSKRALLYGLLSELTNLQRTCYFKQLTEQPIRRGFMLRLAQQQIATEDLYDLSLKLEPRDKATLKRSARATSLNTMSKGIETLKRFST